MIVFLKTNIQLIKDCFTIVFACVGSLIAILTYRQAKKTILQPIRAEVIKQQSEILTKLLQTLKDSRYSFEARLDYNKIVTTNALIIIDEYGYVLKNHKEILGAIQKEKLGFMIVDHSVSKELEVIQPFEQKNDNNDKKVLSKEKFEKLKKGEIIINKIYLTEKHMNFVSEISEFSKNPFMPRSIQDRIDKLIAEVKYNLSPVLKKELELFMLGFSKKGNAFIFNPTGIYNEFNHLRIHHRDMLKKLNEEIRKYLRIDEKWE